MLYEYTYSLTDEVHYYEFSTIPLKLVLSPSYFITTDLDATLNIFCIDIIRCGDKGHHRVGETVCHILKSFIENNTNYALGYYPSSSDNKEVARIALFNKWCETFIDGDDITKYKSNLSFPAEDGAKDELVIEVFAHKDYPQSDKLLIGLNAFSKKIADK